MKNLHGHLGSYQQCLGNLEINCKYFVQQMSGLGKSSSAGRALTSEAKNIIKNIEEFYDPLTSQTNEFLQKIIDLSTSFQAKLESCHVTKVVTFSSKEEEAFYDKKSCKIYKDETLNTIRTRAHQLDQ